MSCAPAPWKSICFLPPPHRARMEREESDVTQTARALENCRLQFFLPTSSFHAREKLFLRPHHRRLRTHLRSTMTTFSRQSTRFWQTTEQTQCKRERCLREYQVSASLHRRRYRIGLQFTFVCTDRVSAASDLIVILGQTSNGDDCAKFPVER